MFAKTLGPLRPHRKRKCCHRCTRRYAIQLSQCHALASIVAIGPDGRLYATTATGNIYHWNIQPDGTLNGEFNIAVPGLVGRVIIGIAFDNAIEASQQLKERGGKGRVEAMYYQEGGDFEFMIRNRINKSVADPDQLAQAGYTTKKDHAGLGLANVKELVRRHDEQMLLDYGPEDGWFNFSLTLLLENVEEEA